jgi:hypothetical protein
MDHRIEYFHTLVEKYFKQEDYEVSYVNKVFYVKIILTKNFNSDKRVNSLNLRIMSEMMNNCLCVFLKPNQFNISVRLPLIEITDDIKKDYSDIAPTIC